MPFFSALSLSLDCGFTKPCDFTPMIALQRGIIFRSLQLAVKSIHEKPFPLLKWAVCKTVLQQSRPGFQYSLKVNNPTLFSFVSRDAEAFLLVQYSIMSLRAVLWGQVKPSLIGSRKCFWLECIFKKKGLDIFLPFLFCNVIFFFFLSNSPPFCVNIIFNFLLQLLKVFQADFAIFPS